MRTVFDDRRIRRKEKNAANLRDFGEIRRNSEISTVTSGLTVHVAYGHHEATKQLSIDKTTDIAYSICTREDE